MGLREEKKKQTRKAISDMATVLFIERGYDSVTTAEIAERAKVSVPTLFNYFPNKESLVFDDDAEQEAQLVDAVMNRKKGQSVYEALLEAGLEHLDSIKDEQRKNFKSFMNLIESTPALNLYSKQMWMRHEKALADAIRKESKQKLNPIEAGAIARFVLDAYHRSLGASNPKAALKSLFKILSYRYR
ncbi:TetR/AcrR family transcriptional regulator [Bdellovibrio sp. SKB1291214]|uniref:TetR/AcrR family transcriptional regulator n=1 Tax=Bdellovibrio sp. SKB1291214 TaxID=1732569 RepID=UPI000B516001|nr:TetR/AcrR family transcriptional regulator [Bdellovibrio sp. SKB1291214]UYL07496.1 TetR/AcrR family transcriptional regulator [Bdellovibrio sp. SKB1291214]